MSQHLHRFRATLSGLEEAAGALRSLLEAREVDRNARYNVELAFDEVVANIIRHGRPTGEIEAMIRFDDDEIVLTFEDDGIPFDPRDRAVTVAPSSIDEAPIGGLGLALLSTFLTRMAYERTPQQRNRLTLTIPAR